MPSNCQKAHSLCKDQNHSTANGYYGISLTVGHFPNELKFPGKFSEVSQRLCKRVHVVYQSKERASEMLLRKTYKLPGAPRNAI